MAEINGHEYVDLGLPSGVLWSKFDYGSNSETSAGGTYTWYSGTEKYNPDISNSNFDGRTVLELQDDIVNKNWGGNWCIPTKEQFEELIRYCSISSSDSTNKNYRQYSNQGNSIKFPGKNSIYWANELRDQQYAYVLYNESDYDDGDYDWYEYVDSFLKTNSYRIRPVWVPSLQHTVNIYDEDGSLVYTETLNRGDLFSYNPTKENCEFLGFFDENKVKYSTLFSVNKDLNLTINWYNHNDYETVNGHSYVDLGLPSGTLWATMNIGATSIFDPGTLFAWGETETKESFNKSNYKWIENGLLTKYNIDEQYGIVDNKMNLDLEDDVAHVQWGGTWTLPTSVFVQELRDNCRIEYFDLYIKLTSNINNKSIYFFNDGQYNDYLTSQNNSSYLYNTTFCTNTNYFYVYSSYIYSGQFVRPIIKKKLDLCTITYKDENTVLFTDQIQYGNSYLILQENPSKDGYLFRDWLLNNSSVSYKAILNVNSDIELIANWVKAINITLINQNDEVAKIITVSEFDSIKLPPILGNIGYCCYEYNTQKDGSGNVYNLKTYPNSYTFIEDITLYAQYRELKTDYVDFDLPSKTLWAKYNIGAISETEYDYQNTLDFWFGDPLEVTNRNFEKDYKYGNSENTYTKYTLDDQNYNGIWYDENQNFIGDGKSIMDKEDDPAYVYLGKNWRTPTKEQWEELLNCCIIDTSSKPYKIISKTDSNKYIYLPNTYANISSGCEYLLNTLNTTKTIQYLYKTSIYTTNRDYGGKYIRPVMIPYFITYKNEDFEFVDSGVEFTIKNPDWIDSKKYITSFNTEPDGSGITYNIGDVVTLEEDLTLYAQWADKLIVYLDPNIEGRDSEIYYCLPGELFTLPEIKWDKLHRLSGYATSKTGEVTNKIGSTITITEDITLYAIWKDLTDGHEFVDLGLPSGLLWASEIFTEYYAWGEIDKKPAYNTTNYKHSESNWYDLTKYNYSRFYGKVDRKKQLELKDDVIYQSWQNGWRIPTKQEYEELINNCTIELVDKGYKVTSKINNNSIFFGFTGKYVTDNLSNINTKGYYWCADINIKNSAEANILYFNDKVFELTTYPKMNGCVVRPVWDYKLTIDEPVVPDPEPIPDLQFTGSIGTYNVRYWNGEDDPNNQGDIAWPNRKEKVFNFLCGKYGSRILGLQEITTSMYSDFISKQGYSYIGYGRDNGECNENALGEQIGIWYRLDNYEVLEHNRFFYNNTERSSFNRLCVWAKFKDLNTNQIFYVFNNHLAHDSASVRKQQVEALLRKIKEIAGNEIVFILGDFNLTEDEESYNLITSKYKDTYKEVDNPQGGYNETNNTYTGLYSTTDTTPKRVDYVFTNVNNTKSYIADNDNMGLEKYPSDHLPVVVTFNT